MTVLVFSLVASIGASGGPSGDERRITNRYPGRSSLIGMIGAALGRDRNDDFSDLDSLEFDVAVFSDGYEMRDFHTVQAPPATFVRKFGVVRALQESIKKNKVNTVVSYRDYRTSVFYGVCVRGDEKLLEHISSQMNHAVFPVFLGRKSCSLSAPVDAHLVDTDDVIEAFKTIKSPPWIGNISCQYIVSSEFEGNVIGSETVADIPTNRKHWNFGYRDVFLNYLDIEIG